MRKKHNVFLLKKSLPNKSKVYYSRLVLFDIDGTLAHCGPTPRRLFKRALTEVFGTAGPIDEWIFDGKTDPMIVRELMAAAGVPGARPDIDRALERYVAGLRRELSAEPAKRVYPGVLDLLSDLSRRDVLLGLLTGNVREGARTKLESLGLWDSFVVGAFADDSPIRKELVAVAVQRAFLHCGQRFAGKRIVVIGDTEHDVNCGRHLGVRAIGVGTGRATREQLLAHGADQAFADFTDVRAVATAILA
jgi:phosphoglycolate phosphatase